jgi:hypothetical protein
MASLLSFAARCQCAAHQVRPRLQEVADAFDDDAGLPRAGSGDDHDRPLAVLDDRPLRIGQWEVLALGGSRRRYGDDAFPPVGILSGGGGGGGRSGAVPEPVSGYITNDIFADTSARTAPTS